MALAFTTLRRFMPQKGGTRLVLTEITGDTSYPTGGTAIAASAFNLRGITAILPYPPAPLVDRIYIWDRVNGKLMAQVVSTASQVAAAVDCSADKVVAMVVGY